MHLITTLVTSGAPTVVTQGADLELTPQEYQGTKGVKFTQKSGFWRRRLLFCYVDKTRCYVPGVNTHVGA